MNADYLWSNIFPGCVFFHFMLQDDLNLIIRRLETNLNILYQISNRCVPLECIREPIKEKKIYADIQRKN